MDTFIELLTVREVLGFITGCLFTPLVMLFIYSWVEPGESDDKSIGTWLVDQVKKIKPAFNEFRKTRKGIYEVGEDWP